MVGGIQSSSRPGHHQTSARHWSWWRWEVSDSNKFVLIRSEGRGSVGKQLVLRTASTYQPLVKAPSWLHWDWLLKWWGCTPTTRSSVIVGMQITSINETAGFTYCRIPQRREKNIFNIDAVWLAVRTKWHFEILSKCGACVCLFAEYVKKWLSLFKLCKFFS